MNAFLAVIIYACCVALGARSISKGDWYGLAIATAIFIAFVCHEFLLRFPLPT